MQAQYWQDPLRPAAYLARNVFLPAANNALPPPRRDPRYAPRLAALQGQCNKLQLDEMGCDKMQ